MPQLEKFLFETEFERPGGDLLDKQDTRDPDTVPLYTEPDMTAARREAYEQGNAAGLDEARNEISAAVASAVQTLGVQVTNLLGEVDARAEEIRKEAANLAFQIGRTLAGALLDREPVSEIEGVIRNCLSTLDPQNSTERLAIRVSPALADEIRTSASALAEASGFAGAVTVAGDESLNGADCSAEWSKGGAVRNQSAADEMIGAAVRRYIESSGEATGPVDAKTIVAEAKELPQPPADLHADSKAVKIEEAVAPTSAENIGEVPPPVAAADAGVEPSADLTPDASEGGDADNDAAAAPPQDAEGPASPSDQ